MEAIKDFGVIEGNTRSFKPLIIIYPVTHSKYSFVLNIAISSPASS